MTTAYPYGSGDIGLTDTIHVNAAEEPLSMLSSSGWPVSMWSGQTVWRKPGQLGESSTLFADIDVSPRFRLLFREFLDKYYEIIGVIHGFLYGRHSIPVVRYILDVYSIDDVDQGSYIPYIEVHIGIQSTRELLEAWKALTRFLESRLGPEALREVDIFLTRAT